jgi:hypothetical protein
MTFQAERHAASFNGNNTQTASFPAGLREGDLCLITTAWGNGGGSGAVVTAADADVKPIGSVHQGAGDTTNFWMCWYDPALTLVFNSTTNDWCVWQIVAFRNCTGIFSFNTLTPFGGSQVNSPVPMTFAGGVASAGDDLVVLWGLDPGGNGDWTYTSASGGWTNLPIHVNSQNAQAGAQYLSSVGAGPTGSMSFTGIGSSTDYVGIFLSLQTYGAPFRVSPNTLICEGVRIGA